jgi:CHAD domain-containing protein
MAFRLSEQVRSVLEELSKNPNPVLARRAQLLLDTEKGSTAREIASRLGISRSRVYFWRGRFYRQQLGIFPILAKDLSPSNETNDTVPEEPKPASIQPRQEIGLLPIDTMEEAGLKVWSFYFAEMLKHEEGTIAGEDIEELHDMRVATRRLRAAFELFGEYFKPGIERKYKKGFKQVGRALGKVRDWDVFIDKAKKDIQNLSENDQQDLQPVIARWYQERETAREEMLEVLQGDEYHDFNEKFSNFLANPKKGFVEPDEKYFNGQPLPPVVAIRDIAPQIIYGRFGVVRTYDAIINQATILQLHALRIEVKRLHYALNFFEEVLGSEVKAALKSVKDMQDILGDLHDSEVACLQLGNLLQDWETYQVGVNLLERENPGAVLNYLSYKHRERHERLVAIPEIWKNFINSDLRANLAKAISFL